MLLSHIVFMLQTLCTHTDLVQCCQCCMCCPVCFCERLPPGSFSLDSSVKVQAVQLCQLTEDVAIAAAAKQAARPSSFLQAAGGSTAPDNNRGPAGTPQPGRGGGGAGAPGGGRGRGRAPPRAPPVTVPNEDFDFEEMMKKFNKQSQLKVSMQRMPSSTSDRPTVVS